MTTEKKTRRNDPRGLRRRAEEIVRKTAARLPGNPDTPRPGEMGRSLHELQGHQIELTMQNEKLHRVQAELEAARARYFDLYDLAPVGYCILSEGGVILEANLTAATLLGETRGALVRLPISRFILKEDLDLYSRLPKGLLETGEPQARDLRMVKKDGTPFRAHLAAAAAQDADGTTVFRIVMSENPERKRMEEALKEGGITLRDISERRRSEAALREREERDLSQVEAINDVAYSINSGGEFTYISPVVMSVLGYEPDEMTGRGFLEFVHAEDHALVTRKFSELREGVVGHGEYRFICKSGDVKWVRSQSSPIFDIGGFAGGRGILVDVSEQKRTEQALHREKENFRRSLEESPLGVRIVTEEGETLYANRAFLDICGYGSIEELKATPVKNRYTPKSYAEFLIRREKRRQGIGTASEYTIEIIGKDGEVRYLQVFRKEILWDGERQFQTIYNDITERKRAEETLAAQSHQLEETNAALRVLLQRMKEDQQAIETKIMTNIRKLVLPNLEKLRSLHLNNLQAKCLETITANLQQVTSPLLQNLAASFAAFTPREIQVAHMVREGKTSKEIADILNTSIGNIDFHRDNIRKKLGLSHKKSNLRTFLMRLSEK